MHNRGQASATTILFGLILSVSAPVRASEVFFVGLGDLGGSGTSRANAISANGEVVVGATSADGLAGLNAFRWTLNGGMQLLTSPPNTHLQEAYDVSADGSVIVGTGSDVWSRAFRYSDGSGTQFLTAAHGNAKLGIARGVSADGTTVVGRDWVSNGQGGGFNSAFQWTPSNGLSYFPSNDGGSTANGVSADGSVAVGTNGNGFVDAIVQSISAPQYHEAYSWPEGGLGDFPGDRGLDPETLRSESTDVSDDGSIIVGWGTGDNGEIGFRYTDALGMVPLVPLANGNSSAAFAVSPDGTVAGGSQESTSYRTVNSSETAVIWDQNNHPIDVRQALIDAGLSPFELIRVTGIAADNRTIVGWGRSGNSGQAFIARLPAYLVPEPSTAVLAAFGLIGLVTYGCRRANRRNASRL